MISLKVTPKVDRGPPWGWQSVAKPLQIISVSKNWKGWEFLMKSHLQGQVEVGDNFLLLQKLVDQKLCNTVLTLDALYPNSSLKWNQQVFQ